MVLFIIRLTKYFHVLLNNIFFTIIEAVLIIVKNIQVIKKNLFHFRKEKGIRLFKLYRSTVKICEGGKYSIFYIFLNCYIY